MCQIVLENSQLKVKRVIFSNVYLWAGWAADWATGGRHPADYPGIESGPELPGHRGRSDGGRGDLHTSARGLSHFHQVQLLC